MSYIYKSPVASNIPFDPAPSTLVSTDVDGALKEIQNLVVTSTSPGFSFGRSGICNSGTFLQNETVPSNLSGRWVYITSAVITRVFISNETVTTYTIEIMYHSGNGTGLTSLGFVTVTANYGGAFPVSFAVPTNKQIAIRVATTSANSAKNIVCGLQLSGSI